MALDAMRGRAEWNCATMHYNLFGHLPTLISKGLATKRAHERLPLSIYNYTPKAQYLPPGQWERALEDCRGLILDTSGRVVGRPFRKFWNLEQVSDQVPDGETFNVWEKLDGSLGIACEYEGTLVTATRGSFQSDQAKWFDHFLKSRHPGFLPGDLTYLFEIIYPENRVVVDYGATEEAILIAALDRDGRDRWDVFEACDLFQKASRFDGIRDFDAVDSDERFQGQEGFVVQWKSGFRAKVKLEEYRRLHRIVTGCNSRTIWQMLRAGDDLAPLYDRVPDRFGRWATGWEAFLRGQHVGLVSRATAIYQSAPDCATRGEFAAWAKGYPKIQHLLFRLHDRRDIDDDVWRMIEPPFQKAFHESE